jgi:glycosyltransferase involved in cell wall biosynthesis
MRRFLYITPYFPPLGRVGALRPLKFLQHLPNLGWMPVVLCDLWRGETTRRALLDAVPDAVPIFRDYSRHSGSAWRYFQNHPEVNGTPPGRSRPSPLGQLVPAALTNPEIVPLGQHGLHLRHSVKAAKRVLSQIDCEAIVVNADPFAAIVVGDRVSRESGLPLFLDLRDPWSVCDLRRPMRPRVSRWLVDRYERRAVEQATRVILNTNGTRRDYLAHYPDLNPEKFVVIRNHADSDLTQSGSHAGFDRFTALFLGHFRRFVEGDILLEALALLARRGITAVDFQLVVTGNCPESTWAKARSLGVEEMLQTHPFVPYTEIGSIMRAADLLVLLNNDTDQRIPAKFYDYVTTHRPLLAVADNAELGEMLRGVGSSLLALGEPGPIADAMQREYQQGRQRVIERDSTAFSSRTASMRLAELLDEVAR